MTTTTEQIAGKLSDVADVAERYTVEELRDVMREAAAALTTPEPDAAGADPIFWRPPNLLHSIRPATPQSATPADAGGDARRAHVLSVLGVNLRTIDLLNLGFRLGEAEDAIQAGIAALRTRTAAPVVVDEALRQKLEGLCVDMHSTGYAWTDSPGYGDVMDRYAARLSAALASVPEQGGRDDG